MDIFILPIIFIGILICYKHMHYNNLYRYGMSFFILLAISQVFMSIPQLVYNLNKSLNHQLFIMNTSLLVSNILIITAYTILVLGFLFFKDNRGD
ncbi:hypothetical protein MTAT_29940 [Moorella thermoacetica]|uniref:Uncharacterized protein n=1 Tax=Neomoorella thermoacetica TaxID=1525 RepID=A0A5D3I4A9_NEOTH|nr:hypothetical protein Maut_01915 [Moorella thermoacetica]OIQ10367.1 hypothetical protein MOOTH_27280 [Moorella thermoacetica]OIQ52691.1 hypothetical protein MORE_26340 [Moorella thermoacetica]TYL06734.1 hypothetical protein MTAT_29940 [Moorella thermoacetica]